MRKEIKIEYPGQLELRRKEFRILYRFWDIKTLKGISVTRPDTLKEKGRGRIENRYYYQMKFINFPIKEGDKVLDIGCGNKPFPLATHLADKDVRPKDKRPFTLCDINNLPFKDKEFDFVYCAHVLEHCEDPKKACDELMRVGKAGYIETPTRLSDILFDIERTDKHHLWNISILKDSLVFMPWQEWEKRKGTSYFSDQNQSDWKNPVQDFVEENWDLIYNMFLWKDKFKCVVLNG